MNITKLILTFDPNQILSLSMAIDILPLRSFTKTSANYSFKIVSSAPHNGFECLEVCIEVGWSFLLLASICRNAVYLFLSINTLSFKSE